MGQILNYIDSNNEGGFHCYHTRKFSLDDNIADEVTQESYDRDEVSYDTKGNKYAESDTSNVTSVKIPKNLIDSENSNFLKYFLDGSRHTFKVDDIAIGGQIYPIVAGQTIIGCCHRKNRDSFKKEKIESEFLLSLPVDFCGGLEKSVKKEDYLRKYAEDLSEYLKSHNKYAGKRNLNISRILLYDVDGTKIKDPTDKRRFLNSGIAQIQNAMTDAEQLMVENLCKEKKLKDDAWLVKDGSIQYNPHFSLFAQTDKAKWDNMRSNYQHVIGLSKSFDPMLLKDKNRDIAKIIAELKPFHRTKAYFYCSEQSNNQFFCIWYLRLRKSDSFRQNNFSDIVKCELLMLDSSKPIDTDKIDLLSASIIREAYPVCYGKDARWANHLYPVYLTESFCKTQYIDKNIFLGLF